MSKKTKDIVIWVIVIAVFVAGLGYLLVKNAAPSGPSKYDAFASCLGEKGAVFYGAFWCPHCLEQKKMFGSAAKLLPYVECSTADGRSQLPVCKEKNVEGYPTWEFADGSRLAGQISFEVLSEKTLCPLPEEE